MPFQEEEATGTQLLQRERCTKFATEAAERIRSDEKCLFSLLPHQELARLAGDWYEACAQAMLRGNYGPIDKWVRSQSRLAAEQGFAPKDLLQLLLICRSSAIEMENWNEDILSAVDEVIQEVFGSIHTDEPWNLGIASGGNNSTAVEIDLAVSGAKVAERKSDRRRFTRNRLRFPIRIRRSTGREWVEECTQTRSISRGGIYFMAHEKYQNGQVLKITFPYWNEPGGINREYASKVVRLDLKKVGTWGVGVDFLESLGHKAD